MSIAEADLAYCRAALGKPAPRISTLVLIGAADTTVPVESLWSVWSDLDSWPTWSPLHVLTTWTGTPGFRRGASFEQTLDLGFPLGKSTENVIVDAYESEQRVSWSGRSGGVRSCHLWHFTARSGGGSSVSNVEVFAGLPVAVIRPLVQRRWRRQFQAAVDGLIHAASTA